MDRKQREDAINEVSFLLSERGVILLGPRPESHAASVYHHVQRELYGQEVPLYCDGFR